MQNRMTENTSAWAGCEARLGAFLLSEQSCPFCPKFPIILVFSKTRHALEVIGWSGVSITNAACRMRIPKSTLADWVHTQNESDEDGVAARREIRRKQIARCEKIGDKVLRALDRKAEAAAKDTRTINDGLAVLEKAAKDGVIALSEAEVASLRNVVSDYTGVGLRELAGTMKDVAARQETLEQHLGEKDGTGVQITFVDGAEELAE